MVRERLQHKAVTQRLDKLYDTLETGKIKLEDLSTRIQYLGIRLEQHQETRGEMERTLSDRRIELADMETVNY